MYIPGSQLQEHSSSKKGYTPGEGGEVEPEQIVGPSHCEVVQESVERTKEEKEMLFGFLRSRRNAKLAESDVINTSAPLTTEQRSECHKYRQELRDLPQNPSAPWPVDQIPWPTMPSCLRALLKTAETRKE